MNVIRNLFKLKRKNTKFCGINLFLVLCFSFLTFVPTYAQTGTVSLELKEVTLPRFFQELEKQSAYRFSYKDRDLAGKELVTVSAKNQSIKSLLTDILSKRKLAYQVTGDKILITVASVQSKKTNLKRKISGIVMDEKGETIAGANVSEKATTNGTVTDVNGQFSLEIEGNNNLLISYIGYNALDLPVKGKDIFNITLREDSQSLDEVVVVGYGTQKKINLTGSVVSISGKDIAKRPVTNSTALLQGLVPGVAITSNNGAPGQGVSMQIRGMGTFSGAGVNPLVLIDGIEGNMSTLDPNTIESVSVLKDAASAAIYGSRAANGVVLVTTKDGNSSDGKLSVSYNFNYGIHKPTKLIDLVTNSADYMTAWNTRIRNRNYGVDVSANQYPEEVIENYRNATDRVLYPNFDWVNFMVNPAPTQTHNISVNGGKQTRYNLSLGYLNEDGTMEAFNYKRYNASLNIVSDINKKLKIGANVNFVRGDNSGTIDGPGDFGCALAQAPTYMPTLPDGSGRYTWKAYPWEENNKNPYLLSKELKSKKENYDISAQAWTDYEIIKGLHWTIKGAVRYNSTQQADFIGEELGHRYYHEPYNPGGESWASSLKEKREHTFYTNFQTYVDYDKKLGEHQIGGKVGYSNEENNYNWMNGYRKDFISSSIPELNAGSAEGQTTGGSSSSWAMQSVFGRLNYSFCDRYLFEANMRADGTSRLAPGNRWGVFPSFSAGWRISEESFMTNTKDWLNSLKLRASWGKLGNQNIGTYPYQAMLSLTGMYPFDNSSLSQGVAQTTLNNYNIKWETTTTTNVGVDALFFNSLSLSLDVYKKLTEDVLRSAQVNALVGLDAPTINDGAMQNVGFDLDVKYQNRVNNGLFKGLTYGVGVLVSGFKNKLVDFGAREDLGSMIREEGRPWNSFYLLQVDGIFQSKDEIENSPKQFGEKTQPGMLKYKDVNGDNVINNDDRVVMEDGVFPKCSYGFTLNAEWKGFDLYTFFQGVAGSKVYVKGWGIEPFVQGTAPTKDQFENSWTPENHSTKYVMLGDPVSYSHPSTYLLKDNSYLRLKTLQLGYSLPKSLISKVGLTKLRLYFSGDNLLTFTSYEGMDPERTGSGDFFSYPQNKIISFGCNVEF